jgi:excisionase family DNA binding protein
MKVLRAHDMLPEPPLPDDDSLLTLAQVARELRCSKGHVQNLIHGRVASTCPLPSVTLGRRRLVRFARLREWIRSNEQMS